MLTKNNGSITMKKQEYPKLNKMPYFRSIVNIGKTKADIIKLLTKYGIRDYQWTKFNGKETLKFIFDGIVQTKEIKMIVELPVPEIKAWKGKTLIDVPENQSMRLFYFSLKSILEATQYGLMRKEEIFFSYILTELPNGEFIKIKDLIKQQLLLPEKFN